MKEVFDVQAILRMNTGACSQESETGKQTAVTVCASARLDQRGFGWRLDPCKQWDCKLRSLNETPVWEGWQFLSPAATFGTGADSLTPR
ncbi:hypothetical protein, variant [Phialophora macrospora]|uniref:Uncharacterized protein n=1 Tax=Phialophora macrospora TaxID=1851006 RepID=A0A0D2FAH6_9EURO|nr:hypothetical protein, variant [Phialophora macrospora]